jgi:hypothetical protein
VAAEDGLEAVEVVVAGAHRFPIPNQSRVS